MTSSSNASARYNVDTTELLQGVNEADLAIEFNRLRPQLRRMVSLRLSSRLSTRMDPSDIVQEAFLRANANFSQYRVSDGMSLASWLRIQTRYAVGDCHRKNLGTQKRDVRREEYDVCEISTAALDQLADTVSSASSVVARKEVGQKLRDAIQQMSEIDQEILMLRHLEGISISDAASELNITVEAAKKRHLRAIRKLQKLCEGLSDEESEQER
ncbi:MAG: sigma-70 family RNA polymerase sigma factor [Planctomycetaceae bacterium]